MSMGPEPPDSCGEEEPWTRFDHPGPVALDYLNRWCEAVQMQADRAVGTLGGASRWVDAALLVMALNEARRAAELARAAVVSDPKAVTAIREAVRQFDDAMPGVRGARDMIEHFDAYERGTGDTQQPGVKRPKREANKALAQAFSVEFVGPDRNRLSVGTHIINVATARDSADQLKAAVYLALRTYEKADGGA